MLVLCFVNFCSCTGYTLLTTFFPNETTVFRGMTSTQNSLIFAIYAAINVVACPLCGYYLPTIGAKFMLLSGILWSAVGSFMFAITCWEYNAIRFTIMACIIRVFLAFACSQYLTAAYSVMTHTWSERRTQAVGLLEMTTGFAMIIGPMVGSALYNVGGYQLPFQVLGVVLLVGIPLTWLVLRGVDLGEQPSSNSIVSSTMLSSRLYSGDFSEQLSFSQFMKVFTNAGTYATIILTVVCWSAMDFVMPILQIHVAHVYPELSPEEVTQNTGLMFVVLAVAYGVSTPLVGKLCTDLGHKSARPCMLIGTLLIAIAYILMGPEYHVGKFFGLDKLGIGEGYMGGYVHISIIFVIIGIGLALIAVPSVEDLVQCCYKVGLPREGMATVAVVSGFYNCILFIGEFVGPMAQGAFTDALRADPSRSQSDVISLTYFYWGLLCGACGIISFLIYFGEWLVEKAKKTVKSRGKRASLGDTSLIIREQRARVTSLRQRKGSVIMGPQSFTLSCSYRK